MNSKNNLAIFASANGNNIQAIYDAIQNKQVNKLKEITIPTTINEIITVGTTYQKKFKAQRD